MAAGRREGGRGRGRGAGGGAGRRPAAPHRRRRRAPMGQGVEARVPQEAASVPAMSAHVRAAGGVVWRAGAHGPEIVLIHRPKYDDWSLPKGKNEPGEDDLACALREVEEETSLQCEAGDELPSGSYHDRLGRPKIVRYWVMRPVRGDGRAQNEVDEVCWMTPDEAKHKLTYEHDRELIGRLPPLE